MNRYTTMAKWAAKNPNEEISVLYFELKKVADKGFKKIFKSNVQEIDNSFDLYNGVVDVQSWTGAFRMLKRAVDLENQMNSMNDKELAIFCK